MRADGQLTVTDPDSGQAQFTADHQQGQYGELSINNNGHWTYTANNDNPQIQGLKTGETVTDTLLVHSVDGTEQKITVTINGSDDKAVIGGTSTASLTEDKDLASGGTLRADGQLTVTDPDSGQDQFTADHLQGQYGELSINNNGHWTYTSNNGNPQIQGLKTGETVTDTLLVRSIDGTELKIIVTINGTNDLPVVSHITSKIVDEGSAKVTGQIASHDLDHGDSATFSTTYQHAGFNLNTDGSYTFDPTNPSFEHLAVGEHETLIIPITATDNNSGQSSPQNLIIRINGTNDLPVVSHISSKIANEGGTVVTGQIASTDLDHGDTATFATTYTHAGFSLNTDGSYTLDPTDQSFDHLAVGEHETLIIPIVATDNQGGSSAPQNLIIRIDGTNDLPVISHISSKTADDGGSSITGQIASTDLDHGDTVNFTTTYQHAGFTLNTDGSYSVDPTDQSFDHLAVGEHETLIIPITATDSNNGASSPQNLIIRINGSNDLPVISHISSKIVDEGAAVVTGQIASTDLDHGDTVNFATTYLHTGFSLNTDGSYSVDPTDPSFNHLAVGEHETLIIPIVATDNQGGSSAPQNLIIRIDGTNDLPVVSHISSKTVDEGAAVVTGRIASTDLDHGDTAIFSTTYQHAGFSLNVDGSYKLDPTDPSFNHLAVGEHETLIIPVIATDSNSGSSAPQNLIIRIDGTNDLPVVSGISSGSVTESGTSIGNFEATGKLIAVDPDTTDTSIWAVTNGTGSYGSLTIDQHGQWHYQLDNSNPSTNALTANQKVNETFTVTATDSSGTPVQHTVTVAITGSNDGATITAHSYGGGLGDSGHEDVYEERVSGNSGPSALANSLRVAGVLYAHDPDQGESLLKAETHTTKIGGVFEVEPSSGEWKYHIDNSNPAVQQLRANESIKETFTVSSADGTGHYDVEVIIHGTNDLPVVSGNSTGTVIETGTSITGVAKAVGILTATDPDTGDTLSWAVTQPQGVYGSLVIDQQGNWAYQLDNSVGSSADQLAAGQQKHESFWVTATDSSGVAVPHKITIDVTGSNDKPIVSSWAQLPAGTEDKPVIIHTKDLLAHASDVDGTDTLAVSHLQATHGALVDNHNGTYTFTPEKDYNGEVQFTYDVKDAHGGITHTAATTSLHAINDNPDVTPITDSLTEDTDKQHQVNLLGNATDVDGDSLSISQIQVTFEGKTGPLPAGLRLASDGHTLIIDSHNPTFQHLSANQHADIVVHYMVDDNHGGQSPAVATLTMAGSDDKAQLQSSTIDMTESQALHTYYQLGSMVKGTLNLVDPDTNDHTQFAFSNDNGAKDYGDLTIWPDGSYEYDLDMARNHHANDKVASLKAGETLTDQYQVQTSDGQTKVITVTIHGENDNARIEVVMPQALSASQNVTEENFVPASTTHLYAGGLLKVIDVDHGDAQLQAENISTAHHGEFTISARSSWSYKIDNSIDEVQHLGAGESFTESHTVHSKDGSASQVLTVTVHGTNDAPTVSSEVQLAPGVEDTDVQLTTAELIANATDIDNNDIGQLSIANLVADNGTIIDNKDGTFRFSPKSDYNGPVHFSYDIKDGHGGVTHTGATTSLTADNDISVISGDSSGTLNEGNIGDTSTATGHLAISDVDITDTPTFSDTALTATTYGHIAMVNGQWTYTVDQSKIQDLDPNDNDVTKHQVIDHHTFTASDGSTQVVDIVIKGTNDKPIIESAHAAPAGSSSTLKIDDFEMVSAPTGANIDVAPTDTENAARWGADQVEVGVGMKLVGLYKPGSDHNWIPTGHEATISTAHSGAGGYSRIDNHDWWAQNHVPDTVNTGSGGASGHGNAWTGGIAVFEAPDGTQHIGIVNRVCTGGGSEVDYLYFHSYTNLHPGAAVISGQGVAGETITVKDDQGHAITTAVVDTHGHWEVAAASLGNGQHTLHIENAAGQSSAERIYDINGSTVGDITPAGLTVDIKEDTAHIVINGELRTSDVDHGDNPAFVAQADHATQYGHFSIDAAGKYHYTINNNNADVNHLGVNQSIQEHIAVTSKTADGEIATSEVIITINGSVDAPTLSASAATAQQGSLIALNLQAALTDTGGDAETLTLKISGLPDTATLNHGTYDSVAKYWVLDASDLTDLKLDMKDPNFHGDLHFNVTATATSGGESESTTQSVSLHVNAPPVVASALTDTETEGGTAATINLLQGATDPDNAALSIASVTYAVGSGTSSATLPAGVTLGSDGHTLTIDPSHATFNHLPAGTSENITVSYEITDGDGGIVNQTATLTFTGTNDIPVFGGVATGSVTDQTNLSASGQLTITDLDTGESNFQAVTGLTGTHGTLNIDSSGNWTYNLNTGDTAVTALASSASLTDHVTVTTADGTTKVVDITIQGSNDGPTITTVALTGTEDKDYTFSASNFGFTDVDTGDTLAHVTITDLPDPAQGLMLLNGVAITANQAIDNADINNLTFKPTANFNGDVHFNYTVNDGTVDSAPATTTLTIANVNDAPTVTATAVDLGTTNEDTDKTFTEAQILKLVGASDVDGDNLSVSAIHLDAQYGTFTHHGSDWVFHGNSNLAANAIPMTIDVTDGHTTANAAGHIDVSAVADGGSISLQASAIPMVSHKTASVTQLVDDVTTYGMAEQDSMVSTKLNDVKNADPGDFHGTADAFYPGFHLSLVATGDPSFDWSKITDIKIEGVSIFSEAQHFDIANIANKGDVAALNVFDQQTYRDILEGKDIEFVVTHNAPQTMDLQFHITTVSPSVDANQFFQELQIGTSAQLNVWVDREQTVAGTDIKVASVDEDTVIPLHLQAILTDTDGSEQLQSITIHGLPVGASLSVGTLNADGTFTVAGSDIGNIALTLPQDYSGKLSLTIDATVTDSVDGHVGDTSITHSTVNIDVAAVAEIPTLSVADLTMDEDSGPLALSIGLDIDSDASETQSISISGIPSGTTLSAGQLQSDGSYTLSPAQLTGLTLLTAQNQSTTISLSITATNTDGSDHKETTNHQTIHINPILDMSISAANSEVHGVEAKPISLDVLIGNTADTHETITQSSVQLPTGWSIVGVPAEHGVGVPANTYHIPSDQLAAAQILAPTGYTGSQDIVLHETITESGQNFSLTVPIKVTVAQTPFVIESLETDTGSSHTDFITSDGQFIVHGTGTPGAKILTSEADTIVDQHGNWILDLSKSDHPDGTFTMQIYEELPGGVYKTATQEVTVETSQPTVKIDVLSSDDWIDATDHNLDLSVSGTTTHVVDGNDIKVTINHQDYVTQVHSGQWSLVIAATDVAAITDGNYHVKAEVQSLATSDTSIVDRSLVVSADMSTLVKTESTSEDTHTSASGALFSLSQHNTVTTSGDLVGNYGTLKMGADGTYHYQLDNKNLNIQSMREGETHSDNFLIDYTDAAGTLKHSLLNIGVHGTNDAPLLTGTFELSRSIDSGFLTKTHSYGHIMLSDVDSGDHLTAQYIGQDNLTHDLDLSSLQGEQIPIKNIGYFNIDSQGKWDFTLSGSGPERTAMNAEVASGHIHTESIKVILTDSEGVSREETLTIHIGSSVNGPQIFGSAQASMTEDSISTASGSLDLLVGNVKVASGVNWQVQGGSSAQHGDVTIDADGHWHYDMHNNDVTVQQLGEGDRLSDKILVTATDSNGHSVVQELKIEIIGTNDVPTIAHHQPAVMVEDSLLTLTKAELLTNVQDTDSTDKLDVDISSVHLIGGGTLTAEADHWIVHPTLNFDGNLRLEFDVTDGHVTLPNAMTIKLSPDADTPTMFFTKHVDSASSHLDTPDISGIQDSDLALNIHVASPDSSETMTVEISGLPTNAVLSAGTEHNGIWTVDSADLTNLKVTPPTGYHGDFDLDVKAISHDGTDTAEVSQVIGVHVIDDNQASANPAPSSSNDEPEQPIETDTFTLQLDTDDSNKGGAIDHSQIPHTASTIEHSSNPVDHYLNMLGIDKQTISDEYKGDNNIDHLAAYTQADMSAGADPLIDEIQVDAFDNPLDDEHKEHHQQFDIDSAAIIDEPTNNDSIHQDNDDDLLHQALNDMHNQL
ncbi:VCBS domain-containing protein [Shewanella gelidimarina]|uniref:VCBS domain-containing protein n=1 Tax=Shewanella gelidimarina TaxID=56813 RepID=UPI00200D8930|nr:VCBS domain-containing protein [Shewanella gelidimarina]MCL1056738.1 VCBS domain-containing protein [Shewanella gelidimarina]